MSSRNPFPLPKFENDVTLSGFRPRQRQTWNKPTHIAQTEEPWSRLNDTATFSSSRRNIMHDEIQGPRDSLDFQLESLYDHHRDLFGRKNQIFYQRETFSEDQRKQEELKQDLPKKVEENYIKMWVDPKRSSVHSIK